MKISCARFDTATGRSKQPRSALSALMSLHCAVSALTFPPLQMRSVHTAVRCILAMSTKCVVEGCGKWSFQGGLCRGHLIVAPQAATPKAAAAAAALASAPRQPSSCPLTLTGPPAPSGAQGGREKGGEQPAGGKGGAASSRRASAAKTRLLLLHPRI